MSALSSPRRQRGASGHAATERERSTTVALQKTCANGQLLVGLSYTGTRALLLHLLCAARCVCCSLCVSSCAPVSHCSGRVVASEWRAGRSRLAGLPLANRVALFTCVASHRIASHVKSRVSASRVAPIFRHEQWAAQEEQLTAQLALVLRLCTVHCVA